MRGKMIVLEGLEATGKTTIAKMLKESLEKEGYDVIITREPGGVDSAEFIRKAIMDYEVDGIAELLLFAAARREHLIKKVIPSLNEGKIVICDRFVLSSYAYQGYGQGIKIESVDNIQRLVCGDIVPYKTFYIDVPVEMSMGRKHNMEDADKNRLDKQTKDFYSRVRSGYREIIKGECSEVLMEIGKTYIIDGEKNMVEIKNDIMSKIM